MVDRILLRLFGIKDDTEQLTTEHWTCPTCGHKRPAHGTYYLGKLIDQDQWLRSEYENDLLDTDSYIEQMEKT